MKTKTTKPIRNDSKISQSDMRNIVSGSDESSRELFIEELQYTYGAEKALVKAIPKMIKNASENFLVDALSLHLQETKGQITRLEKIFILLGLEAEAKKCEAIEGFIKEAEEVMEETEEGAVRDEGIIASTQKVEHYEISTYSALCTFAKTLGEDKALLLLLETLDQEKNADKKLNEILEFLEVELNDRDSDNSTTLVSAKNKKIRW